MQRTFIDETISKVGEVVHVSGWAHAIRRMGEKLIFVDVRDGSGIVQVVFYKPELSADVSALVDEVRPEWVLEIEGTVKARNAKDVNPNLPTGTIEIGAARLMVLNRAKTPPFEVNKDTSGVNEETRLKYRYLDLRSERLQRNIRLRNRYVQACREYLLGKRFVEIETPYLTQATPEGSRDFIVPSRLQSGKFFALPQSPQQYKQLLITTGF